jgi:hypothetical protein
MQKIRFFMTCPWRLPERRKEGKEEGREEGAGFRDAHTLPWRDVWHQFEKTQGLD